MFQYLSNKSTLNILIKNENNNNKKKSSLQSVLYSIM